MKLIKIFAILVLAWSCSDIRESSDSLEFSNSDWPQEWNLNSYTTGISGETISGDKISFEETYIFHSDGSFIKNLKNETNVLIGEGTFVVEISKIDTIIKLSYDTNIDEISYCSRDNQEYLYLSEDKKTLSNTRCVTADGPGLYYQRVD